VTFRFPILIACALLLISTVAPLTAERRKADRAAEKFPFRGLTPGEFVVHKQQVRVEIVLIGFDASQVNENDLRGWLPGTYRPLVRYPQFYGLNGRDLGLEYSFTYSITRAKPNFANAFFAYLTSIGTARAPTAYQVLYNNQTKNLIDVTGPILDIDAASVEKWLDPKAKPRQMGYTVYFVNWYGRSDFRFHIYSKKDAPDPDTGFPFGATSSRAMTSWGGTSSRTWFYDFSAGPEFNTDNYVVDMKDLNGDGVEDYRMPPIWEYAANGYRSPNQLGFDMGLLTRFVAINLLFTTSPLYDPLVAAPDPLGRRVVDMTMFEDDPASKGINFIDSDFARVRWQNFQPYYNWNAALRAVDPIDPGAKRALDIFTGHLIANDCWNDFGTPFAQLFCYFSNNLSSYVPEYGDRDYVVPVVNFNTTADVLEDLFGLLGFADDNWIDGTQSLVFTFGAAEYRSFGYGFTGTVIHEVGHHIGMSHPHDGYDSEFDFDYGPGGALYFAWEGDESDTVMHYLSVTNRFGEHNRDNMYRWETAGYLNWANALAGDILASPDADHVFHLMVVADALAARAKLRFNSWRYGDAVEDARNAYSLLAAASNFIGVSSDSLSMARMALPSSRIQKYICRPRDLADRYSGLTH
jgi:hypothetical protein